MAMSSIKLDVVVEMKNIMTKRPPRLYVTQMGSKKIDFKHELGNRLETLQELDDIDRLSETITCMIQQTLSILAKAINKPQKSGISSPTRALMTKSREMVENGDDKERIEYA